MSNTITGNYGFSLPNTLDNENFLDDFSGNYVKLDGSSMMEGNLDMGLYRIKNINDAIYDDEAVNLGPLTNKISNLVTLDTTQSINSIKTIFNPNSTNNWGLTIDDTLKIGNSSKTGVMKLYGLFNHSIFQATNENLHIDLSNNAPYSGVYFNYYSPSSNTYLQSGFGTGNCLIGTNTPDTNYKCVIDRNANANALKVIGPSYFTASLTLGGVLDMGTTNKITNLANGTNPTDAINLSQLTTEIANYVTTNTNQTITSTKTIDPVNQVAQIIMRKSALTDNAVIKFRETTSNIWDFGMRSGSDNHMHLYHIPTANYMHYWTTTGRYGIGGAPTDKFSIFNGSQTITRTDNLPALLNITTNSNSSGLGSIISLSSLDIRSSGVKYASTTNTAKQFYMGRPYRQATNTESRFVLGYVNTAGQDPAFEVGGTGIRNYIPLIACDGDNARVGINTITPLSSFHVTGNTTITSGTLDMTNNNIQNVLDPLLNQDVATKYYVDNSISTGLINYVTTNTNQTITGTKTITSNLLAQGAVNASNEITGINSGWGIGTASQTGASIQVGNSAKTGIILLKGTGNSSLIQQTTSNLHLDNIANVTTSGIYLNWYSTSCNTLINSSNGTGNCLIGTSVNNSLYKCSISKADRTNALKVTGNSDFDNNITVGGTLTINNTVNIGPSKIQNSGGGLTLAPGATLTNYLLINEGTSMMPSFAFYDALSQPAFLINTTDKWVGINDAYQLRLSKITTNGGPLTVMSDCAFSNNVTVANTTTFNNNITMTRPARQSTTLTGGIKLFSGVNTGITSYVSLNEMLSELKIGDVITVDGLYTFTISNLGLTANAPSITFTTTATITHSTFVPMKKQISAKTMIQTIDSNKSSTDGSILQVSCCNVTDLLLAPKKAAAPTIMENGAIYYDTTSNKLRVYSNGFWVDLH